MPSITIRNVPGEVIARLKQTAASHGRSMEEEVRRLLQHRFRSREDILAELPSRWAQRGRPRSDEVDGWIELGRQDG